MIHNENLAHALADLHVRYNIVGTVDLTGINDVDWLALQEKITDLYQESFDHDQRIIVMIDRDWYKFGNGCGSLLEGLQRQINHVDISNFFVMILTTNPDLPQESQWLQKNVSRDSVPMHFVQCRGRYDRLGPLMKSDFDPGQIDHDRLIEIKSLDQKHRDLLLSKTFCMAPWTHLYPKTFKKVKPCCVSQYDLGDLNHHDLATIWNQEPMRDLRRHMLQDQPHSACARCHDLESLGKFSYRSYINQKMLHHVSRVDQTGCDGTLNQFQLNYLHFEFNNLCNLSCRMCDHHSSSAWHAVAVDLGRVSKKTPALITANDDGALFRQAVEHLPYTDLIKFSGGEPLMMQEFYDILDLLLQQQRTKVELFYNTNLTMTRYRGRSIFDLWQQFEKITVGASLDAEGHRGEYLRPGCRWVDIVKNRQAMLDQCPHVEFFVSATANILNVWHLPDFHRSWVSQGLIRPQDFDIHLLHNPAYLRLHQLPGTYRTEVKSKYLEHLDWIRPLDPLGRSTHAFEFLLSLLDEPEEFDASNFWKNINDLDQYHATELLSIFPELSGLPGSS